MIKTVLRYDPLLVIITPVIIVLGGAIKLASGIDVVDAGRWLAFSDIGSWPAWINYVLSSLIAIVVAFLLSRLIQNLGLLGKISNLATLVFALLYFTIPDIINHWMAWSIVIIQLLFLQRIEEMYDETSKNSSRTFNLGVLLGLNAMLIDGGILLSISLIHALVISGSATFRKLLLGLIGILTPVYLFNAFAFLFSWEMQFPSFSIHFDWFSEGLGKLDILGLVFIGFMLLVSVISVFSISSSSTLRERRRWMLVMGYLFLASLLILNVGYSEPIFIAIVPATVVISKVLLSVRNRKLNNAIFLVFIALVLLINS